MDRQGFQEAWGKVVARAWEDMSFKQRLLTEPATVFKEYGFEMPMNISIRVVENTDRMIQLRCTQEGAPECYVECTSSCYRRPETSSQMQIWSMWRAGWRTGMTVSLAGGG
jgi:Nitrile hydratase, alpha chain